jgi:hypothetical protein
MDRHGRVHKVVFAHAEREERLILYSIRIIRVMRMGGCDKPDTFLEREKSETHAKFW